MGAAVVTIVGTVVDETQKSHQQTPSFRIAQYSIAGPTLRHGKKTKTRAGKARVVEVSRRGRSRTAIAFRTAEMSRQIRSQQRARLGALSRTSEMFLVLGAPVRPGAGESKGEFHVSIRTARLARF